MNVKNVLADERACWVTGVGVGGCGWDKAEDGVGGKEIVFSLLNAFISTQLHSYTKLIYFAISLY